MTDASARRSLPALPSGHTVTVARIAGGRFGLGNGTGPKASSSPRSSGHCHWSGWPGTGEQPVLPRSPQYSHAANSVAPSSWASAKLTPGRYDSVKLAPERGPREVAGDALRPVELGCGQVGLREVEAAALHHAAASSAPVKSALLSVVAWWKAWPSP